MTHDELNALLTRAEDAQIIGNYEEAEKLANEVLAELSKTLTFPEKVGIEEPHPNPLQKRGLQDSSSFPHGESRDRVLLHVHATRILGVTAWRRGNYPAALEYLTAALNISEDSNDREGMAKALGNIGIVNHNLSEYQFALDFYLKALALDKELGNKKGVINGLSNIGNVYVNLSDYPIALEYFGKALALNDELKNKAGAARLLGSIGAVHVYLSDYSLALDYYGKALALNEELGNKAGVIKGLSNIGDVYMYFSYYPSALEYFGKALVLAEELGNKADVAHNLGCIGNVQRNLSDYPLALDYYGKALDLAEELEDKAGRERHLGNIGSVHWILSDFTLALDYHSKALALAEELGNRAEVAFWLSGIGVTYATPEFEGYNASKAKEYLLKAFAINEEIGTKSQNVVVFKSLSDLYATTDRWKESREHLEKYHTLYLEVQSEEATKQAQLMEHRRKIEESERDRQIKLARFQEQEKILHNILPAQIAERMVAGEKMIADSHDHVSVFFSDIVGFTKLSQKVTAEELVGMLNGIFSQFDQLSRKHGLEKIKTIGDSYMAVSGAPIPQDNHAERAVLFALEVAEFIENYRTDSNDKVELRIGIHTGSVVAGVIGENKFSYDMWGDAVNTASRMESHGEPGKIHVSEEFKHAVETLHATSLQFIRRGEIDIKGKGMMKTYFLEKV